MFIILVECIVRYGQDISFEQVSYPYIKYFEKKMAKPLLHMLLSIFEENHTYTLDKIKTRDKIKNF